MSRGLSDAVSTRFFMPSTDLAPYVTTIYLTEFAIADGEVISDWLHPEWANIRIAEKPVWSSAIGSGTPTPLPPSIGTGPTGVATRFEVAGPTRTWGIGILPVGWLRLFDTPANRLADTTAACTAESPFADFAGLRAAVFDGHSDPAAEAARIDAYLRDVLSRRRPHEDESRIHAAHAALVADDVSSVAELAEQLSISSRSLERLSLRAFGFSPKLLLRRQRFLRSLAQFMLDPSLTWIKTLDWHYVDQAHFVRDFRRFMTMNPSTYAAQDHPVLRSAARARAVATGAAVQALHRP
ncbi:MAG: helix-turn-helix domain-containing protein [Novosphingobium sp.]